MGLDMTFTCKIIFRFDLVEILWIRMPDNGNVPYNRVGAGIDYFDSAIYMWGITEGEYKVADSQHFYKYDLNLLVWTVLYPSGNEPDHRSFHGVGVVQGYFYLYLGFDFATNTEVKNVFRTSLTGDLAWEEVSFSGDLIAKSMFASVLLNDSAWVFCGTTISQLMNSVEKIDFANNQAVSVYPNSVMPKRLHGYTFDRFSNSFLMFGGSDMDSR